MNSLINKKNIFLPSFDRGETEALGDEQTKKTLISFVLIIRGKKKPFDEIFCLIKNLINEKFEVLKTLFDQFSI